MDALASVVESALPTVNWFALGEAKQLHGEMLKALRDYRSAPNNPTYIEGLKDVARLAYDFLIGRPVMAESRTMSRRLIESLESLEEGEKT